MSNSTHISCPNCHHKVDVNEILYSQLNEQIRNEYDARLQTEKTNLAQQQAQLEQQRQQLQTDTASLSQQINNGVQRQLSEERIKIAEAERQRLALENQSTLQMMEKELADKTRQVQELNQTRAELSRLQREKDTMKAELEAENEKRLNERLATETARIETTKNNELSLKMNEQKIVIDQLNSKLKDAQQKAEQGSMQLQGEAQELAIEDWLRNHHPLDDIQQIKTGALGADCIQAVNALTGHSCGTIYYESKRTKTFQPAWIEKFKADIRDRNANIGVIISQARPAGHDRMAVIDGIWICNFEEFKGLSMALRNQIVEVDRVTASQVNRGEKMQMLWDYLQSNEFRLQVEAIVDGFTQMKIDLDKEKRAIQSQWKKREKQIDKVLLNTGAMYSTMRGIAGASIQSVQALEFEE